MRLPPPLDRLNKNAWRPLALVEGQTLFLQDAPTRGLFYMLAGSVELRRFTRNGEAVLVHRAKPGETFAEASLFSSRYHCDGVASAASQVLELDRTAVLELFRTDQNFAMALAARFAAQMQALRRRLEIVAIRSAEDRVHAALSDAMLTGPISTFALEIGLSPEAVYRALAALARKGLVEKSGRGSYRCPAGPAEQV